MKRNYGIDLLRIVAMFMIVILHVLGHGGILGAVHAGTPHYNAAWLLESFAYCAVNCYALITGYVHIDSKYKFSSFVLIWLQAMLYSLGISVLIWIWNPSLFSMEDFFNVCFPVARKRYWYLSSYAGLFIFIPMLNAAIRSLPKRTMCAILILSAAAFSLIPTISQKDPFTLSSGYSTLWLIALYAAGACMKKYQWGARISPIKCLLAYAVFVILSFLSKRAGGVLLSYTSPTILLAAVCLFLAFRNMKISSLSAKLIAFVSPGVFGVYLLHMQLYLNKRFIRDKFVSFTEGSVWHLVAKVFLAACIIFVICLVVDLIRHKIFRWLKVKQRLERLEEKYIHLDSVSAPV